MLSYSIKLGVGDFVSGISKVNMRVTHVEAITHVQKTIKLHLRPAEGTV